MLDVATLKSLTAIRPIATLSNPPTQWKKFDKFYLERVDCFGSQESGIILSVNSTPHVIENFDIVPRDTVLVQGQFDQNDRDALLIRRKPQKSNHVVALTDTVCAVRFTVARWKGKTYPLIKLQTFFNHLRRAYLFVLEGGGKGIMEFELKLGSVKLTYTSLAQIEADLYPMAYHFFKDDTEL